MQSLVIDTCSEVAMTIYPFSVFGDSKENVLSITISGNVSITR